jgi:hypothetical protein
MSGPKNAVTILQQAFIYQQNKTALEEAEVEILLKSSSGESNIGENFYRIARDNIATVFGTPTSKIDELTKSENWEVNSIRYRRVTSSTQEKIIAKGPVDEVNNPKHDSTSYF